MVAEKYEQSRAAAAMVQSRYAQAAGMWDNGAGKGRLPKPGSKSDSIPDPRPS